MRKRLLILILCLSPLSMALQCGSGNSQSTTFRKLAVVEDDVANGLKSAANIITTAKQIGAISQEDIEVLKPFMKSVGEANLRGIKIVKTFPRSGEIPLDKKEALLAVVSFATNELVQLNEEGTLRIKDPVKRAAFTTVVLIIHAAVTSIITILNLKENKISGRNRPYYENFSFIKPRYLRSFQLYAEQG